MSVKIKDVRCDEAAGDVEMTGTLDGTRFKVLREGTVWLFSLAKGWTFRYDDEGPTTLREARSFLYQAVAGFRTAHKPT